MNNNKKARNIILIGMMGSGKSTLGKLIAKKFSYDFYDTDKIISHSYGLSITEIIKNKGEAFFRMLEKLTLQKISAINKENLSPFVLSTGGGIILNKENKIILHEIGKVYWLDATLDQLWNRVNTRLEKRPILFYSKNPKDTLKTLVNERKNLYESFSHQRIDTSNMPFSKLVDFF